MAQLEDGSWYLPGTTCRVSDDRSTVADLPNRRELSVCQDGSERFSGFQTGVWTGSTQLPWSIGGATQNGRSGEREEAARSLTMQTAAEPSVAARVSQCENSNAVRSTLLHPRSEDGEPSARAKVNHRRIPIRYVSVNRSVSSTAATDIRPPLWRSPEPQGRPFQGRFPLAGVSALPHFCL